MPGDDIMKRAVLVSGLLNIETTVSVRGFPINYYPIDYPFFGINSNVSGVGCNIAKAMTALGDDVRLVSYLGNDDEADRVLTDLGRYGIKTNNIIKCLKNTPVSAVLFDSDGKRQVYCDLKDIQEQSISPVLMSDLLHSTDIAVLCNINFNRELIRYAHKNGILTASDVHVLSDINDEYNRDFMENADILFLSHEKLPCKPDEFMKQIYSRYKNKIIVIGMGAEGAMMFEQEKGTSLIVPAYSTGKVVNTVGAGDALFSSFLHFYIKGLSAFDALKRAVVFAGIKIGFNGASLGFSAEEEIESIYVDMK